MGRDPRAYLWDAREAAKAIGEFSSGHTLREYEANRMLRSAVERQFEIRGEALNQLSKVAPELAVQIPDLPHIVAIRNVSIHGYAVVDNAIGWRLIHESLPGLAATLDRLLDSTPEAS